MTEERNNRINPEQEPAGQDAWGDELDEIIEGEILEAGEPAESELARELQQAEEKAKAYFDGWQRERADFANYKRRIERDQQLMAHSMKGEIVKKYLPILDDLDRALKARPMDGPASSWANGIELVYRKLQSILEAEGVERIPAEQEEFNPARHEAITHEDSPEHDSGQIIEVVQQGYTLGDRVLRPALVRVAR
jgi:molecular chaperone GrpE